MTQEEFIAAEHNRLQSYSCLLFLKGIFQTVRHTAQGGTCAGKFKDVHRRRNHGFKLKLIANVSVSSAA